MQRNVRTVILKITDEIVAIVWISWMIVVAVVVGMPELHPGFWHRVSAIVQNRSIEKEDGEVGCKTCQCRYDQ